MVLVWRFDRFARSTRHLINALEEFKNLGIDFVSYQENVDTSSLLGGAIFTIISAVAQLERHWHTFLQFFEPVQNNFDRDRTGFGGPSATRRCA